MADDPREAAPEPVEYSIDELAAKTRVPSRTIRFYQSKGALMTPVIRGRVAYYGEPHRERLALIAQLQDRGLRIDGIRDLVASIDRGELDLASFLGIEREMQASWANDQPRTLTEAELYALAGSKRPGLLADLVRVKIVERRAAVYLLESPALLAVAMKMEAGGIDLDTAVGAYHIARKHLVKATNELVDYFVDRADTLLFGGDSPEKTIETLRPTGLEAMRVIFGREMERALAHLVASGKLASLPAKAGKARKKKG